MTQPIGPEFMHKTRYPFLPESDQNRDMPQPPLVLPADPKAPVLDLPPPAELDPPHLDLTRAINDRVSVRRYSRKALSRQELSYLLWCTQGVKSVQPGFVTMRTVPSAGARHALGTYLLINRVQDLEAGLYRFLPVEHKLQLSRAGEGLAGLVVRACFGQEFIAASAVTFVWTAVPYRMTWRYSQRGYRYLLLDAGHVCQNLYLAAEAIGCGACAIAAFDDEQMDAVLGLDGQSQLTLYLATVGKKS